MKLTAAALLSLASTLSLVAGECALFCPMDLSPVCGSNGVTYSNACNLELVKCQTPDPLLHSVHEGECEPVVGGTGNGNGNANGNGNGSGNGAATKKPTPSSCTIQCTQDPFPQCGSDGSTYPNACAFARAQCSDPSLQFLSMGACGA